jgi:hypothetical protein
VELCFRCWAENRDILGQQPLNILLLLPVVVAVFTAAAAVQVASGRHLDFL